MPLSPDHSSASLYCSEKDPDAVTSQADTWISDLLSPYPSPVSDDTFIGGLFDYESHHMPRSDYLHHCRDGSIHVTSRQDSINWILKVHEYYRFKPVTAYLSVNYLDRFLAVITLPQGWPFQLLSVACLSLAAKMEETVVPVSLDLQIFEPSLLFDPKTVQRMELWVMGNLKWRLRSVTPFDFLHFFFSKLRLANAQPRGFNRVLSVSDLILCTTHVIDFLGFPPSAIAAAAVLCTAGISVDNNADDDGLPSSFYEKVDKEMVRSCHNLMEEFLIDACPFSHPKERRAAPAPPQSPAGVLDAAACRSCGTRKSGSENTCSSLAEPPTKSARSSETDTRNGR